MRKLLVCLALAALVGALLHPVSVGARPDSGRARATASVHKQVTESAASVRAYWTKARMKKAEPVKVTKASPARRSPDRSRVAPTGEFGSVAPARPSGASKDAGTSGRSPALKSAQGPYPYTRYEVTAPYTQYPYSTHGKVFFTDPTTGTNYVCSGTAINSENKSVVWTAGHCVNGGGAGQPWYTNWAFVPARKDGSNPFGVWTARELWSTSGWVNSGNIRYDLGSAVMNLNGGSALVDIVGGRGLAWNYTRNQYYFSHGYPAAPPFGGERLIVCESQYATDDFPPGSGPATMGIGCDMTGGSSGGGWVVGGSVYSVNSYGYTSLPEVMFGPYQDTTASNLYDAVRNR